MLAPGDKLGPYEILAQIGAGGMGEVYKARDTRLGRIVAIKTAKQQFSQHFEREARAVAALNHPNICTLHDIGPNYLVMEFVEGSSPKGSLPLDEVLRIGRQVTAALAEAHEKHITHRDLKPGNIMIKPDGSVKVLDFGLAKLAPPARTEIDSENSPTLTMAATEAGMVMGTAAYMAPEQAKGKEVDKRADIWSFGVVLYELSTGKRPFHGADISEILASVIKEQPSYGEVPYEFRRLIQKCLEKDPTKRLRDIGDAWDLLDRPEPVAAAQALPAKPSILPWAVAAMLAAATGLALWAPWRTPLPEPPLARVDLVLPPNVRQLELSPDGRMLAYLVLADDATLWLRNMDSTESRQLASAKTLRAGATFVWSPDSRFLAFSVGREKLEKIDVVTGVSSTFTEGFSGLGTTSGGSGSWNEDGVLIVSTLDGIQKIARVGAPPIPITQSPSTTTGFLHTIPRFLPDGRHFVYFNTKSGGSSTIRIGSVDNTPQQQPTEDLGEADNGPLYFLPGNPSLLLFKRDGTLLAQPFDADKRILTGEPVPLSATPVNTFAAAQDLIVYTSPPSGRARLALFDRKGVEIATLGTPFFNLAGVNVSHDNTRAALVHDRGVWILDLTRGTETRLSSRAVLAGASAWFPDDTKVAFTDRSAGFQIDQAPANGAAKESLLLKVAGYAQDFTRDGRTMLYTAVGDRPWDLFTVTQDNGKWGEPVPYLNTDAREVEGQFSPDEHWVAYASDRSGTLQVYVNSFPDPAKQQVPISTKGGHSPRWSRESNELFYIAADGFMTSVRFTTLGGVFKPEAPAPLFQITQAGIPTTGAAWDVLPNGRFLVNTASEQTGPPPSASVILNWRSLLAK